jgi:hypothetical protein
VAIVIWQLFVIASVAIAYATKGRKAALWVCAAWTAWTLLAVFMLPLVLIQLFFCWGTFGICRWLASLSSDSKGKDSTISELRLQIEEAAAGASPTQARAIHEALSGAPSNLEVISGDEHYAVLKRALASATHRVCILSGWIGSPLLDPELQQLVREAAARSVHLYLGFGWESSSGHQLSATARHAIDFVHGVDGVVLAQLANHEKLLVVDTEYCVIGSNNWLSNASFRNSERSVLIRSVTLAVNEGSRAQRLIEENAMEVEASHSNGRATRAAEFGR